MIFRLKRFFALGVAALLATTAHAQLGAEIARQHAERAGEKLAALKGLRAEGRILMPGETVQFSMLAERPGRLRVESVTLQRRVVQATDGSGPAWSSRSDADGGLPRDMSEAEARDFQVSADFDGVLVDSAAKGYSVDYAGEDAIGDRKASKLLIMGPRDEIFFLWVDKESHEIVKRLLYRTNNEQRVAIETRFTDFRPVGGVLQPHRVETLANGRPVYVMVIDAMEANPVIAPGAFGPPGGR